MNRCTDSVDLNFLRPESVLYVFLEYYKYSRAVSCHGVKGLKRMLLVALGIVALVAAAMFALAGVVPDGAHAWHSIQVAMNSAVDSVQANGAHAWH